MSRVALIGLLAVVCAPAALPQCSTINPKVRWTIRNVGTTGGIQSDNQGAYVNGQSGVSAALQACSGSGDAILDTGRTRWFTLSFADWLWTNQYTPSYANSNSPVKRGRLNIRFLLYVPDGMSREQEFEFTTRLTTGEDNGQFGLLAPAVTANHATTELAPRIALANPPNSPYPNSPVVVKHCPSGAADANAPCQNGQNETWFVYPDPTPTASGTANGLPIANVGALLVTTGSGKKTQLVNAGEFSMPFSFEISLLN